MTEAERRAALEAVASEVRECTRCRLHEGRNRAVPGEGHPSTEVVFVGEGPGATEDREGRPFVGRAGDLLVRLLATIGWKRHEVFITNVVKCRPPENRDPEPDEIAACLPYLRRQLEILDPALVVTLGRHSLGRFRPGARIGQTHGTSAPVDSTTGARAALGYALYHPAAALRSTDVERQTFDDVAGIPGALLAARSRRDAADPWSGDAADPSALSAPRLIRMSKGSPEGEAEPGGVGDLVGGDQTRPTGGSLEAEATPDRIVVVGETSATDAPVGSPSPEPSVNRAADIAYAGAGAACGAGAAAPSAAGAGAATTAAGAGAAEPATDGAPGPTAHDRHEPRADETGQLIAF
ncbi:MAG: uracil-DNA glycosylase family protein [Candidatus Limnocylindrales bacterium]